MLKHAAIAFSFMVCLASFLPAYAQDTESQQTEATMFFSQMLEKTHNPLIASLIQDNLNQLQQKAVSTAVKHRVEIPLLSRQDKNPALPVMVNDDVLAYFIVDTGASYNAITPEMARQLGIAITPDLPTVTLMTGNGPVKVPVVTLHHVTIGGMQVSNVQAVVKDFGSGPLFSGVLGLNSFKDMDVTIKPGKLVLEYSE